MGPVKRFTSTILCHTCLTTDCKSVILLALSCSFFALKRERVRGQLTTLTSMKPLLPPAVLACLIAASSQAAEINISTSDHQALAPSPGDTIVLDNSADDTKNRTFNNDIAVDTSAAIRPSTWSGGAFNLTGLLSGTGDLSLKSHTGGATATVFHFSNAANTFAGTVKQEFHAGEINNSWNQISLSADALRQADIEMVFGRSILSIETGAATILGLSSNSADSRVTSNAANNTLTLHTSEDHSFAGTVGNVSGNKFNDRAQMGASDASQSPNTDSKALNLTKTGEARQTFSGAVSVNNIQVDAGTLALTGTTHVAGTISVKERATLSGLTLLDGVIDAHTAASGTLQDFTLNGGTIDFGGVTTTASISASGTLTLTSGDLLISNLASLDQNVTYHLLSVSEETWGSNSWTGLTVNSNLVGGDGVFFQTLDGTKYKGKLGYDAASGSMTLNMLAYNGSILTWGGGNGTWQVGGQGWNADPSVGGQASFTNDDSVVFSGNSSQETITISGTVGPSEITVANGDYVFASDTANPGAISGVGQMSVTGTADKAAHLTIQTDNAGWSGAILIGSNATVTAGHANALGLGIVTMQAGSTLELSAGAWELGSRLAAGATGTLLVSGTASATTAASLTGLSYSLGENASLTLGAGTYANAITGAGKLVIADNATVNNASGFNGTWKVNSGATLTVGGGADVTITASTDTTGAGGSLKKDNGTRGWTIDGGTYASIDAKAGGASVFRGTVTVTGDMYGASNHSSTVAFESGANVRANNYYLHFEHASTGANDNKSEATIKSGATLTVLNLLQIARDGKGILNIEQGGTVLAKHLDMGTNQSTWTGTPANGKQATLNLNGGNLYLGNEGITQQYNNATGPDDTAHSPGVLNMNSGTLGTWATANMTGGTAKGWKSELAMTIGGENGGTVTVNTQRYNVDTRDYADEGQTIVLKALSGTGSLVKDGLGTLELTEANTYQGTTAVNKGNVHLTGTATLGQGQATIKAAASGAPSVKQGEVATLSARSTTKDATISSGTAVSAAGIAGTEGSRVTMDGLKVDINGDYSLEYVTLTDSFVDLSHAGTVTLSNVTFSEGSSVALSLHQSNTSLSTTENLTHTFASGDKSAAASVTLNGWTNVNAASLVLDLNNSLLYAPELAGKGTVMIWLEGLALADPGQLALSEHLAKGFKDVNGQVVAPSVTVGSYTGSTSGTVVYIDFSPASMPEPATASLSLLGLAGLLLRRRRRAA